MSFDANTLVNKIAETATRWVNSVNGMDAQKDIEFIGNAVAELGKLICVVREFDKQYHGAPSNNIAPDGYGYAIVDGDNDILSDYCNFYSVSLFIAGMHDVAWFKTKAGAEDAIAAFGLNAKAALLNKATLQWRNSDA